MSDSIVFVAHGFTRENVRLQPWRYLFEIARRIAETRNVVMITEGVEDVEEEVWDEGFCVVKSCCLSVRRQTKLTQLISHYFPRQLWWSVTPRSIAYWGLFKTIRCDKYALITCPLYSYTQLVRANLAGVPFDELKALWQQRLIPRRLFAMMLRGRTFKKIFTQSETNSNILARSGVPKEKLFVLRVGIDAKDREPVDAKVLEREKTRLGLDRQRVTLLYFGAIRKLRGFHALIDAFGLVANESKNMSLVVLARDADQKLLSTVDEQITRANLTGRVHVIGGRLTREQVWAHIESSDMVVLPFVIVPSDVPIAILEAMARGRPVIGSSIDGIPELISGRGVVIDPLDSKAFAEVMLSLASDKNERSRLGESARNYMKNYPDWESIGRQAMQEAGLA